MQFLFLVSLHNYAQIRLLGMRCFFSESWLHVALQIAPVFTTPLLQCTPLGPRLHSLLLRIVNQNPRTENSMIRGTSVASCVAGSCAQQPRTQCSDGVASRCQRHSYMDYKRRRMSCLNDTTYSDGESLEPIVIMTVAMQPTRDGCAENFHCSQKRRQYGFQHHR